MLGHGGRQHGEVPKPESGCVGKGGTHVVGQITEITNQPYNISQLLHETCVHCQQPFCNARAPAKAPTKLPDRCTPLHQDMHGARFFIP